MLLSRQSVQSDKRRQPGQDHASFHGWVLGEEETKKGWFFSRKAGVTQDRKAGWRY